MKYISEDPKKDIFTFEATKEELEVCTKVIHLALEWLDEDFNTRNQNTSEDAYRAGLKLNKKLLVLLDEHKEDTPVDTIIITIRFLEASIIYACFNEVCNGLSFGFANVPPLKELIGYDKEELRTVYAHYKKVYMDCI
ncbi:hypothetical protein [Entomobacter blattae]|uniref:Uncharacterized protein n=1 Tax=Entomobacter blattae TaxID=2762277 RepID=A0A7H1NRK9_9PROT|nr:hypothetical protein [Entomobacter blattae]QNT78419.1 hypothetical protein JGUZn3_11930 [Entomobacter blattae]QNT78422.1 hypothetical protein JGUZn3_11960 [Entomobacter blattae]